ncbi:hypothetical protein OC846_001412 [Tilletia horrida]|uniref:Peptidase S8/S53 domain-containing protein n=1 Tax=Tilletia horrida TaxID=155126 RepID=A0AAN6JZW8_9BASI|nr:hypothetical protein OC845_001509 [Tilletia horrida]KAK0556082.1 hypothetical protein OC846_001412 [Tilletia horrida]KAK0568763.1 hypothetical protein OC861_001615 [Tilletia horrida]
MKLNLAFLALILTGAVSARQAKPAAAGPKVYAKTPGPKNQPAVVPRGYLVEFVSDAATSSFKRDDTTHHDGLHSFLTKRKVPVKYQTRYTFTDARIFTGVSLILDNDKDADELRSYPGVKEVTRLRLYKPAAYQPTIASPEFVQSAVNGGASLSSSSRTSSTAYLRNDTFEPHVMTNVNKLHAQGYFGKGQTVGILDTGVDYTHPALNGGKPSGTPCFGPGCPVSGGYDLVGDKYNGITVVNPIPDPDPFADCAGSGHGTHVTGTVIADDRDVGFTGVVPQANVHMYRIFGCGEETSSSNDVIIAGLQKGFFDGVDVLSLSLGGASGWPEDTAAAVASRIVSLGTPVVIANGNDGSSGAFYASAPATGLGVTGAGSVDNKLLTGYTAKISPSAGAPSDGNGDLVFLSGVPFTFNGTNRTYKLYATSTDPNVVDDACSPLPDSTPDLTDYVVVIARGTCFFVDKFTNAYNKGARYVFIYNSASSITYLPAPNQPDLQAAMLTRSDGQYIVKQLAAGKNLTINFANQSVAGIPDTQNGGYMSSFSTYSNTWEAGHTSDASAPGGNILSTWPLALGKYAIISGTSMATPFISGSTAMFRSIKGSNAETAQSLRDILSNTANPLGFSINVTTLETVARQGGGIVDVYRAVNSVSRVSPGRLDLNDSAHFDGTQTITVSNVGTMEQTYTLSHLPAGSVASVDGGDPAIYAPGPIKPTTNVASVKFSTKSFSILPGQTKSVTVTVTPPGLDTSVLPFYSGYIKIKSNAKYGTLTLPYYGVAVSLKAQDTLDTTDTAIGIAVPALTRADGETVITDDKRVYSLKNSANAPTLLWRLLTGTAFYSIDLVDGNTTFVPTIPIHSSASGRRRSVAEGHSAHMKHAGVKRLHMDLAHQMHEARAAPATGGSFDAVKIVGNLEFGNYVPRNDIYGTSLSTNLYNQFNMTGNYTDVNGVSQSIKNGTYRILLRAQKIFTDASREVSYESYLSHAFTVKRK